MTTKEFSAPAETDYGLALLRYIAFLAKHLDKNDVSSAVTAILMAMNFQEQSDGYKYLKKGIVLYFQKAEHVVMKSIYIDVAREYAVKSWHVERSIRYAVEQAWMSGSSEIWMKLFPPNQNGEVENPSNGRFIARVAQILELWQGFYSIE